MTHHLLRIGCSFLVTLVFSFLSLSAQSIYWLDASFGTPRISKSAPDGSNVQSILLDTHSFPEFLVSSPYGGILWSELVFSGAKVHHADGALSGITSILTNSSSLRGLAVDKDSNWIYFASSNMITKPRIERMHADGSTRQLFLSLDSLTSNPRSLWIDPVGRKLYWTEFTKGKIRRVDLTLGALPQDVVVGLNGPVGMAVDPVHQKIYWTEANANTLKCCNFNGSGIALVLTNLSSPNYLTIDTAGGKLYWTEIGVPRIGRANLNGSSVETLPISVVHPTGIIFADGSVTAVSNRNIEIPISFALAQNYPNPFNPSTTFNFTLPVAVEVKLLVLNILGQEVAEVVNQHLNAGSYSYSWTAKKLSSGIYFYKLVTNQFSSVRKMILMK
jgi:DNA-binding beta-propeller fold protein YncE